MNNYVSLSVLVDILTKATYKACQIIHKSSTKTFLTKSKNEFGEQEDPVTQVDHTIQKVITEMVNANFPNLNIVGEQHVDEDMIDFKLLQNLTDLQTNFSFHEELNKNTNFQQQNICLFIDPLDCTRGYIYNKKWECTVMIGVIYKGTPIFGIIGQPYKQQNNNTYSYFPRMIMGGTIFQSSQAYEYSHKEWKKIIRQNGAEVRKFAISNRRSGIKQQKLIQCLFGEAIYCGGSGNKIAMLIRGEIDAVFFINCPLSTWDSCAGEAIILGLKGVLTKPDNTNIKYEHKKTNQTNNQGFICSLDQQLHAQAIKFLTS